MGIDIDFLRAIVEAKISLRHLVKVIDYVQERQGEILTRKKATKDLKIKPSVWSRVVRFLIRHRVIRVELAEDLIHRKFFIRVAEQTENVIPVFQSKDSVVPKMDSLSPKNGTFEVQNCDLKIPKTGLKNTQNGTRGYQNWDSNMPETLTQDTQVTTILEPEKEHIGSSIEALRKQDLRVPEKGLEDTKNGTQGCQIWDSGIPKTGLKGTENGTPETQNRDLTEPVKERKEKRTKKEKKENINSLSTLSTLSSKEKEKEKENYIKEKEKEREKPNLPSWIPPETWNAYVEMRKKIKHPLTEYAVRLYCRAFERAKQGGISEAEIIEAIETSIAKGWQGIFVQGTDILKLKPEPKLPPIQAKKVKKFDGMTDAEYYAIWKKNHEVRGKEVETKEVEIKEDGSIKPVATLVQNLIENLEAKKPSRDERLKMGWGVKTFTSGFV